MYERDGRRPVLPGCSFAKDLTVDGMCGLD